MSAHSCWLNRAREAPCSRQDPPSTHEPSSFRLRRSGLSIHRRGVPARASARSSAPAKDATFAAIGLALLSTVFFAMGDVAAKVLTGTLPAIEVTWLRYVVFCLVVVPTVFVARGTRAMHTPRLRLQIIRALAVAGSSVLFILGLGHLQVAEATAINFISPIFITALSIPLLGEKVGIRRWAAAAVGFLGVMLVVQPGGSAFQVAALLPIGAALVLGRSCHRHPPDEF